MDEKSKVSVENTKKNILSKENGMKILIVSLIIGLLIQGGYINYNGNELVIFDTLFIGIDLTYLKDLLKQ